SLRLGISPAVQAWTNAPDNEGSFLNQLWLVQSTDNGYYSFRNPRSGTYMDLSGGLRGNPANSTNIQGYEGPGGPNHNQQWELIQAAYVNLSSGYVVQRESIHFSNTNPSGSNGTRIFGYQDMAGTSREQDELWKFTLRSVTLSGIMSAPERNQHRLDDMHVISKDHIFLIQPTNLFSNIWRSSPLVSQIHNSVFSNAGDMALTFKTAVTMWAAQNIRVDVSVIFGSLWVFSKLGSVEDISLPFGFVCGQSSTEAVNWTLHENQSSLVFLSPMTGYVVVRDRDIPTKILLGDSFDIMTSKWAQGPNGLPFGFRVR
ncbi:hypothetical protein B0H13DRAFT_2505438, partial [Mycena leptocephala]